MLSWILCFQNCPATIWLPQLSHMHTQTGKMWRGLGPWLPSLALPTRGAQGPSAHRSPTLGLIIATTILVMSAVSSMHPWHLILSLSQNFPSPSFTSEELYLVMRGDIIIFTKKFLSSSHICLFVFNLKSKNFVVLWFQPLLGHWRPHILGPEWMKCRRVNV